MKKRLILLFLVLALTLGAVSCAFAAGKSPLNGLFSSLTGDTVTITKDEYERLKKYEKLEEVYQYIQNYYYVEPDTDGMMEWAIQGMLSALNDPYTFYYNAEDWADFWESDTGEYAGIGIQLLGNYSTGIVTISRVFKDTPAERAGIRKGDVLKRVEDVNVTALTMQDAVNIMRGTPDEAVEVEVTRADEPIVFSIPRAKITVNWIEYMMLENNVGYICLYEFSGNCYTALEAALKALEDQGATALVIDLRDNPGGWVGDALNIADLFLDKELLFYSEDRNGKRELSYTKDGKDDIPLVLLVNEGSASSSEILGGGLQDLKRAKLVGTKTYGKGIIQQMVSLSGEADGIQFTIAQYYLPSGTAVHHIGVSPDIVSNMPKELVGEYFELGDMRDKQLKTAWEEAVALRDNTPEPVSDPVEEAEEAADNAA